MHPPLPHDIEVLPGADVEGEWDRFRVFEALHHRMNICNPMTDGDVGALVNRLAPQSGQRVLDIACGHGELLIRLAEAASIEATGVDLSPWVLVRARGEANERVPDAAMRWVLGDARELPVDRYDIVTCLGASWIWHGFNGTVRAMAARLQRGGRLAVGDLRLSEGADLAEVAETHGRVLTADEQEAALREAGLRIIERIDPGPAGWAAYQDRIGESAESWRTMHPGEEADRFWTEQQQWRRDHDRDMEFLTWSVWIAEAPPPDPS